ncbi:MAG: RluA family pseudouridine synthase [Alphaproteobacteria bacterium]|nr:RluA family pseudouridine synthase [Alphaproteobacteria bacterium]
MSEKVLIVTVREDEVPCRLDRWFKRHYPQLPQSYIQRLLRTKQIRVNGKRAEAKQVLAPEDMIRVPPLPEHPTEARPATVSDKDKKWLTSCILYQDADMFVLNKPAGLAVQGGSGTKRHLDTLLSALATRGQTPKLVHRLDKDTSGVLVVARTNKAAAFLTQAFRTKAVHKTYWALVEGKPRHAQGVIDQPLLKQNAKNGREMMVVDEAGQSAQTQYKVMKTARQLSWLELSPLTGRTHQLRVHCAFMGTPIVGDEKYGKATSPAPQIAAKLHLHARQVTVPMLSGGKRTFLAPLPEHMKNSFDFLGFCDTKELKKNKNHTIGEDLCEK